MTREEFFGAKVVCPYCNPALPRENREVEAINFEAHREAKHAWTVPDAARVWGPRDADLLIAACQRAFERSVILGSTVLVRWEESGCRLEARGTVMVLGAGFFRIEVGTASEWVRVPEYGCPGWSLTNCVRPAWEHTEAAGQVAQ